MAETGEVHPELTKRQQRVVAEILRVAALIGVDRLSQREFDKHHQLAGLSTAGYQFGSWNRAVQAAGLEPYESGRRNNQAPKLSDEELLLDVIRVHGELGKPPSERELSRFGQFSMKPYKARWGSLAAARETAYARYGVPELSPAQDAEPGAAADPARDAGSGSS